MEEDISALQESLLLYTDDELSATEKNAVESLLKSNTSAQSERNLLQQTKLQPDMAVVFEDKALLYRKEGGRVVGFKWWRVAAAAVLLGFGLWTGVSLYKNNTQKTNGSEALVKENKINTGQEKTEASAVDQKSIVPAVENTTTENNAAATIQQQDIQPNKNKIVPVEKVNNQNSNTSNQNTTQQNSNPKKPDNNLPKPYFGNINNKASNEIAINNVLSENSNSIRVSGSNDAVGKINPKENKAVVTDIDNSKTNTNLTAMQVVNANNTADAGNNNRYLNVDDSKEKRSALGGFIRKAKRVLERTTNVKTGDGIKIAGFEIALK